MANARKAIKVRCIETGEVYNSCREAGRAIGADISLISKVVSGKLESAKGFHFVAVEENTKEREGLTLTVQNEQEGGKLPLTVENAQEGEYVALTVQNEQGEPIPVIDSREVSRMMGKSHSEILWYIEGKVRGDKQITGILPTLQGEQLIPTDYFIESSYTVNNRKKRCYLCTRMGCDLLATRQIGEKGILFCAKYVERFNEMEKELKNNNNPSLAREDELILSVVKGATPLDRATALQEYTALITDKATAPLKEELKQVTTELTERTEFIDDINDCFTFTKVKEYNKQLLRDRKDIVLCTAKLNEVAAELGIPINKIDNPIEYSPYRRVNAYPRKVWEKAYPEIKLPKKPDIKLPEKKESK